MIKTETTVAIDIHKVCRCFKDVRAVDQVSFGVNAGELMGLLGPNGAGKTTLVEMIAGLQLPDSGTIRLFGLSWKGHETVLRRKIGLSLQENRFIDKLTAEETLNLFGSFYHQKPERTAEVLEQVCLTEKRKSWVVHLSGGQRQKLALGVALIGQPALLLLDEPTMGLDPGSRQEIWHILMDLKRRGTTMILTTHYMEEAEFLCDRILIMHQGRFLDQGTLAELLARHGQGDIIEFKLSPCPGVPIFRELPDILQADWDEKERKGRLVVKDMAKTLPAFFRLMEQSGTTIINLDYHKSSLSDLFIRLTGRHLHDEAPV
jgi:ABC-2 type transport system ATP-binding protein